MNKRDAGLTMTTVYPTEKGWWLRRIVDDVRRLAREHDTPDLALMNAAAILERLVETPKALDALYPMRKQRASVASDVAVDYLATNERLGQRMSKKARAEVATAWGLKRDKQVEEYLTKYRAAAEYRLRELTESPFQRPGAFRGTFNGKEEFWTRESLLLAVSQHLRKRQEK